jgi:hypothetical protein
MENRVKDRFLVGNAVLCLEVTVSVDGKVSDIERRMFLPLGSVVTRGRLE